MTKLINQTTSSFIQTPPSLSKISIDSQTSLSQSIIRKRLVRKTTENSVFRRSTSRRSSQKSSQDMKVSQFYMKMGSNMVTRDSLACSILRSDILNRGQDQKIKRKRQPTPVPGYISRKRSIENVQQKHFDIENDLMIVQLQKQVADLKQKVSYFEKRSQINEKQLKAKINKIFELQRKLTIQIEKQKLLQAKIKSYEDLNNENQVRLSQTKSALEKLKKNIVQDRLAEIQSEKAKLRKENQSLKSLNNHLGEEIKKLQIQCKDLQAQVSVLKNFSSLSKVLKQSSSEEENEIKVKDQYTIKLQNTISKLQIKLFYLNRKKIEQLQKLKEKKNEEISRVRDRLSQINTELKESRNQNEKLRKRLTLPERTTIMSSNSWPTHEEIFCLSLSP